MDKPEWYSAKLRFAVMVETKGADLLYDCVFLFRAADFDMAFERAIKIGETQETEYRNGDAKRVNWKFSEIISLDVILAADLDGAEICADPVFLSKEETIPFETKFDPRLSKPTQTI
jgi:hypothetical protein